MTKTFCDICKTNETDEKVKFKRYLTTNYHDIDGDWIARSWIKIDICRDCYNKMMDFCRSASKEN